MLADIDTLIEVDEAYQYSMSFNTHSGNIFPKNQWKLVLNEYSIDPVRKGKYKKFEGELKR